MAYAAAPSSSVVEFVGSSSAVAFTSTALLNCIVSNLSKARSRDSGDGWTYRSETVMLLCPEIRMTVKAFRPGLSQPGQSGSFSFSLTFSYR